MNVDLSIPAGSLKLTEVEKLNTYKKEYEILKKNMFVVSSSAILANLNKYKVA
jgi:hypothetical protein